MKLSENSYQGISEAVESLKKTIKTANLLIIIDAADNAEMAAEEFNQPCFVHELIRENLPDGCQLVAFCRTERINLLRPPNHVVCLELEPFSEEETAIFLKNHFPRATTNDVTEFHRLTNGNPRIQANALSIEFDKVEEMLLSLGPSPISVSEQIEAQLNSAVSKVKETFPINYQNKINSICLGLSNLPPFIPIKVLATAAEVNVATIKSLCLI